MKCEIGFVCDAWSIDDIDDTRLKMTVTAQTQTELTMLRVFAKRMGWSLDINTTEATVTTPEQVEP